MSFYINDSGSKSKMMLKICLNILTLSLLCELGHAAEHLAPVIPLHGNPGSPNQCHETCHTEVCADEALRLVKLMDEQIDPCTNFYEFACGNFIKNTTLEDADISIMGNAQIDLSLKTARLTAEVKNTDLESFQKTKIFFQNCIDEARIEKAGSRPLLEILNNIGGWPVLLGNKWNERGYNWVDIFDRVKQPKMMEYYFPASIAIEPDNEDTSRNAIKLYGVKLIIGPNYFVDGQGKNFLQAYLNNMVSVAVALGARNDSTTRREMQQVLDFEAKLYNLTTPDEKLNNMPNEKTNIPELSSKCPGIPWLEFINKAFHVVNIAVDQTEKVYVADMPFTCGVAQLARNTPKRVIANYLAWRVAKSALGYMSKKFVDIEKEFNIVVKGSEGDDRLTMCLNEAVELFTVSISTMFVRKYFDMSTAMPIAELFSNLKSALRKNLQQTEWMDDRTRRAALEKIDAMNVTVGFAEELKDDKKVDDYYRDLHINPGLYLQTAFNVTNFLKIQSYKSLREPSSKNRWSTKQSAAVLNAYNVYEQNNVEIPAGMINTFYKKGLPQYMHYGSLGTIVGHEVMHGFDSMGKNYDKQGNQVNWWQTAAEGKFREKARCLIEQYGNFVIPEINMKVNGELTQSENIADNGGFRAAYLAYSEWVKRNNVVESCLPTLNYTPQQMFWISAATAWCSKKLPDSLRDLMTDEHSPDNARIIITFSNINEFARDFNCPVGSRMNPEKKCTIW